MSTVFQIVDRSGATFYSHGITTSVATVKPGLLVVRDAAGDTVSLAAASGSAPLGVAYGTRDMVYAPTSNTFASGEPVTVALGHMVVLLSADYFASGSIPTEMAGIINLYAAASGKYDYTGTNYVGRLLNNKTITLPTGGTGTSQDVVLAELQFIS